RAIAAATAAINNPLLEDTSIRGAKSLLVNVTGGADLTLAEIDDALLHIQKEINNDEAHLIYGNSIDEAIDGKVRISVIATGMAVGLAHALDPKVVNIGPKRAEKLATLSKAIVGAAPVAPPAPMPVEAAKPTALEPIVAAALPPRVERQAALDIPAPTINRAVELPPIGPARPAAAITPAATRSLPQVSRAEAVERPVPAAPAEAKKRPSIFEMLIGRGKTKSQPRVEAAPAAPAPNAPAPAPVRQPAAVQAMMEERMNAVRTVVAAEARPASQAPVSAQAPGPAPVQVAAARIEVPERPAPPIAQQADLLDIPAFLRRKAS
ncbi:MAG: hypothetical protein FJX47_17970, partial [Alphaproteobacteria bacterium]|nr:hypothetical protein [Alphaproteobacteria bacterium]